MSPIMSRPVDIVKQPGAASTAGDELLELVHAVVHRHRHRMLQALRDGANTVTHLEARVLGFFGRCPGATPGELAQMHPSGRLDDVFRTITAIPSATAAPTQREAA